MNGSSSLISTIDSDIAYYDFFAGRGSIFSDRIYEFSSYFFGVDFGNFFLVQ